MKKRSREEDLPVQSKGKESISIQERFRRLSCQAASGVGSPGAFIISCLLIVFWGLSGPYFRYSDTWQLVINTSTTIVTFLMVFLIQNTQNRDAKAIHLKLDELIRSVKGARNNFVSLQDLTDEEIVKLEKEFARLRKRTQKQTASRVTTP